MKLLSLLPIFFFFVRGGAYSPLVYQKAFCKSSTNIVIMSVKKQPNVYEKCSTIWKFSRPHTLIGTGTSIISTFGFASNSYPIVSISWTIFLCAFINIFITGINQIYDISIDKINKPNLVIPSSRLSIRSARWIVGLSLLMSLILSILPISINSKPLSVLLLLSALIGAAYSVPPFRFKVNPFMALFCIVSVRGFLVPTLVYLHALRQPMTKLDLWKLGISSPYFMILSLMISLMKDVPDTVGDRTHGIQTFTLRFGAQNIINISNLLQKILNLIAGSLFLLNITNQWNVLIPAQIFAQGLISITFFVSSLFPFYSVNDPEKSYMRLWDFFYYSYAVLPLITK